MRHGKVDRRIVVGCEVFIREAGHSYTNWFEQAEIMGLKGYRQDRNAPYDEQKSGAFGEVVVVMPHPDGFDTLYGVRFGKKEYICNQGALTYVRNMSHLPEDLFEL